MITLADAQLLTQDKLYNYVIDELRKDTLLDMMPFDNTANYNGGSTLNYTFDRIKTHSGADFRAINEDYEDSEATPEQVTIALKILGGKYKIDRVINRYVHGAQYSNQEALQIEKKIAAIKRAFTTAFISGDSSQNAKQFDGLNKLISPTMTVDSELDMSTTENIDKNYKAFLDYFRDLTKLFSGRPTAVLCSNDGFALIQKVADRAAAFTLKRDDIGREWYSYNGSLFVPVGDAAGSSFDPIPTDRESGKTAYYPVRLGLDGVHAIAPEGNDVGITVYPIDDKSSAAQREGACEMVTAIALKDSRAAGKLSVQVAAAAGA